MLVAIMAIMGMSTAWADNYFTQDYEADGVTPDWTTNVSGRHTPIILEEDGNHFLAADPTQTYNNGATLTGPNLNVPANKDFTLLFDLRISTTNSNVPTFTVKDASGSAFFTLKAKDKNANTIWIANDDTEITLPGTNYINNSTVSDRPWYNFKISQSAGITYLTVTAVADNTIVLERTVIKTLSNANGLGKMTQATNKNLGKFAIDNIIARDLENGDVPAAVPTTYTIKYTKDGSSIKEDLVINTIVGIQVTASDDQIADFVENNQKYIYVSGNTTITTVEDATQNIITLVYRDAASYTYTVKASTGKTITSSTAFENDAITYYYPQYQLVEGVLYEAAKSGTNPYYGKTFTLTSNNQEITVDYSATEITNVVFFSEAELIEGASASKSSNADIRCSSGYGAYFTDATIITNLPAGKYKVAGQVWGGAGTEFTAVVNGETVWSLTTTGSLAADKIEEATEFVLNAAADITIPAIGNANRVLDYIIIQKTGDVEVTPIEPAYGEIWSGTKAFPVDDYETIELSTAYFKDFVQAGDVIKVTLQPAADEARAEAPMRDIKRFGELALLAADESIIAEEGEVALDTEDYSFTVEESWVEKLGTGNNIYLRGRNLTVTKIELLEAVFEPVDCTAKVSTENWLSEQGSVGGPVTLEGIAQKEQYNASTTAVIEGDVLYQTVEGLDNGTYSVELYANASYTSGRGFTSDIIDGQLGRVVVYAGDVEKTIPVFDQGWVNTNNIVTLENVVVSDGTLRMGLKKIAPGTNWHTIQIKSLTQVSNKAEADADAQDTYWKGIAATVAAYEAYANVAGSEKAAIVAAETKAAAQAAIPPFYAAKPSYDALADIIAKANSADYDVAEAEALMAAAETTAEQAAAKAAELLHPVTLAVNTKAVEGASKDNPIETNFVVNGTFDTAGVIAPWKSTTGAQNQTTANNQSGAFGIENSFFFENWNPDPFTGKMYQVIEDIPNGLYILKIAAFVNTFDATAQYVYANTDQTPLTTGNPTAYEVQTNVTTNTIEIGLEQIVAVANWMGVDNVSLIYKGDGTATSINEVTAKQNTGNAIYNLQGQKVQNTRKGLYIINGKKVMK